MADSLMPTTEAKQVERTHYEFGRYMDRGRWTSLWHQLSLLLAFKPAHVLEIGPGPGVLKRMAQVVDLHLETLDLDPELDPDHVGSATALPFSDEAFDVVCAFQMLEHLPYDKALIAYREMHRVARLGVVVSVPDVKPVWRVAFHVPRHGMVEWMLPKPWVRPRVHHFDGEHHWEIGKRGYGLPRVMSDFAAVNDRLTSMRLFEEPYYRFFISRKLPGGAV